jgi:hypothetical protein
MKDQVKQAAKYLTETTGERYCRVLESGTMWQVSVMEVKPVHIMTELMFDSELLEFAKQWGFTPEGQPT